MIDFSTEIWNEMAEFNNALTAMVDISKLSPADIIVILDMMSARLKQVIQIKKGE